jgi:hypothetical protein
MSGLRRSTVRLVAGAALWPALAGASTPAATPPAPVLAFAGPATGVSYGGYAVGPLAGTVTLAPGAAMPGQSQAVTLFCVDFLHAVQPGEVFTVNVSAISSTPGALALTRHADGLAGYRRAVWLADQFAVQPPAAWGGIQGAIWKIFGAGSFSANPVRSGDVAADPRNEAYWTARSRTFAGSAEYATYDYARYAVYTDVDRDGAGSRQEFIGRVVPEPGTLALAGAGAAVLAGWGARRGRRGEGRRG